MTDIQAYNWGEEEKILDPEQEALIKKCAESGDVSEWNEYVEKLGHANRKICLDGLDLGGGNLDGIDLRGAYLRGAFIMNVQLNEANLTGARLQGTTFNNVELKQCVLEDSQLDHVHLSYVNLKEAKISGASLIGAMIENTNLEKACFNQCISDGETRIDRSNSIDRKTDFRGVGIDNIRFGAGIKQLLEYNNRRLNWEDWYTKHRVMNLLVRFFWWISDYGHSTLRILMVFWGISIIFAVIYIKYPDFTTGITSCVLDCNGETITLSDELKGVRAIYFSVVTMTTLGFGDIHVNPSSFWGHLVLSFHVILGYVVLGAIITRLSILFNSDGPVGEFQPEKKSNRLKS